MNWMPIVLSLIAGHTATAAIDSAYVTSIVGRLHNEFKFKTLPIFWSRFIEPTDSLFVNISQELFEKYSIPQMHFTVLSEKELRYQLDHNSTLSIVLTDHMAMEILQIVNDKLRGIHLARLLLVLREPVILDQLRFFRGWLWEKQFTKVLVLFEDKSTHQKEIFTIDAYPTLEWMNKTNVTDTRKLFTEDYKDMKQYPITINYMEDVPRVFHLKRKMEEPCIVGRHAKLIKLFAKYMNIKLIYKFHSNTDLDKMLKEFDSREFELSVHSYSMFDLEEIGSSYPLETVRWCIMVPLRSEVAKRDYIIYSFDKATWSVTMLSVVYIAFLLRFVYPPASDNAMMLYFLRGLTIIIYSSNMSERITMPTLRQFFFFTLVFLLGFILSCIYSTYLTSYCTNMVFQPPIDSVEDLVKENLRVMVIDYELEAIRTRALYGETFLKLLYPVSYHEVNSRRTDFDIHYAYSIRQDRWNFLNKQQRGLEKVFFRLSKICFGRHFTMFPLQYDSHLRQHLDPFIMRVMQAGLDLFWDEESFRMAVTMKYSKVLVEQTVVVQPLRLDYFQYVYAGYWVLVSLSLLIFTAEVSYVFIKKTLVRAKAFEEYMKNHYNG